MKGKKKLTKKDVNGVSGGAYEEAKGPLEPKPRQDIDLKVSPSEPERKIFHK